MTSFGKLAIEGPGALALLERACCNRIDRPVGAVVYTQMLDERGGILADVTVTRLGEQRFRLVSGAGAVDADRGWLELSRRPEDGDVTIRDVSNDVAVVGLWGPAAREILAACTADDVSAAAFPFRVAREIRVGPAPALAQRITYVGELGYELYVEPDWAVQVWDHLTAAGAPHGITPGGYRALESLRLEKGYRYFGTDLTASDTPYESGLGFCVALDKGDFNGRAALNRPGAQTPARRLRTLTVGDDEQYVTVYGGEAVRRDGELVGRIRSCAYGYTVKRNVALATVAAELEPGAELTVDVFDRLVPATIERDVLYDPDGERTRG
jgi:4-methylaminobutanoate oxidase (formaldehyde-forming)